MVTILVAGGVLPRAACQYVEEIRHCADLKSINLLQSGRFAVRHSAYRSDHGGLSRAGSRFLKQHFCFLLC